MYDSDDNQELVMPPDNLAARAPEGTDISKKILVVDDEWGIRSLVPRLLKIRFADYEIVTAEDGQQGWNIYQQGGIDLIISDIQMPIMSGVELCDLVNATGKGTPFVFMTGYGSDEQEARLKDIGAAVLRKPFYPEEIYTTLEQYLR